MTIGDLRATAERVRTMRARLEIGIPEGPTERTGASLAKIAAAHVFGTSDGRIPQRDFLRPAIQKNLGALTDLTKANLARAAAGEMGMDIALGQVGAMAVGNVQDEIVNGSFVPNAPATIRRKKSSKPLIDTGSMRQSVMWRVTKGGR
jgi:hypothetical protein